jgi:hypothetical protein
MIIDSGPAEDFGDGIGSKNFFLEENSRKRKSTSPGNQTKQVAGEIDSLKRG